MASDEECLQTKNVSRLSLALRVCYSPENMIRYIRELLADVCNRYNTIKYSDPY